MPGGTKDWSEIRAVDRQLVAGCRRGDESAWSELWRRYGPLVKAMARRAGCDSEEARDVLQRVALVALEKLDSLEKPEKIAGWLAGIARFQALGLVRQRRPHQELDPALPGSEPDHAERLASEQRLALLRQAFVQLDARCQRLLQRLDLADPCDSYEQVAASEGLATSSIGPIRRRCLERLRARLLELSRRDHRVHCTGGG